MVVLTAITLFGRKWLHKEKYSFEEQMHLSSNKKTEDVLASSPSEHWLLGFKDRDLEEEYLNDLVDVSKGRLYLGHGMCAFFIFVAHIVRSITTYTLLPDMFAAFPPKFIAEYFVFYVAACVIFLAGLISR